MQVSQLKLRRKWEERPITSDSLKLLDEIDSRRWVLDACLTRIPRDAGSAKILIEYALEQTEKLRKELNYDREGIHLDVLNGEFEFVRPPFVKDSLTYPELISYRMKFMDYLHRIAVYEELELVTAQPYSCSSFLNLSTLDIAISFALKTDFNGLNVIFEQLPEVRKYALDLIDFIHEGVDPCEYKELITLAIQERQSPANIRKVHSNKDWHGNEVVNTLKFLHLLSQSYSEQLRSNISPSKESLASWCVERFFNIDSKTGMLSRAIKFLSIVHKEIGIPELEFVFDMAQVLYNFIYSSDKLLFLLHNFEARDFMLSKIEDLIIYLLDNLDDLAASGKFNQSKSSFYVHLAENLVIPYLKVFEKWNSVENITVKSQYLLETVAPKPTEEVIENIIITLLRHGFSEVVYSIHESLQLATPPILSGPEVFHRIFTRVLFNENVPYSINVANNMKIFEGEGLDMYKQQIDLLRLVSPSLEVLHLKLSASLIKDLFCPGGNSDEIKYMLKAVLERHFNYFEHRSGVNALNSIQYFSNLFGAFEKLVDIYTSINPRAKKSDLLPASHLLKISLINFKLDLADAVVAGKISSYIKEYLTIWQIEETVLSVVSELADNSVSCDPNDIYIKLSNFYLDTIPDTPSVFAERKSLETIGLLTSTYKLSLYENSKYVALPSQIRATRNKKRLICSLLNSNNNLYLDIKSVLNISKNLVGITWGPSELAQTLTLILEFAMKNNDTTTGVHIFSMIFLICRYNMSSLLKSDNKTYISSVCDAFSSYLAKYDESISRAASSLLFSLVLAEKSTTDLKESIFTEPMHYHVGDA